MRLLVCWWLGLAALCMFTEGPLEVWRAQPLVFEADSLRTAFGGSSIVCGD